MASNLIDIECDKIKVIVCVTIFLSIFPEGYFFIIFMIYLYLFHLGSGYKVNIPIDDHDQITNIVKSYIPESSVMPLPGSVSFSLPLERSAVFTDLFASLEKNLPANVNIGVSCTTLDDVFLK